MTSVGGRSSISWARAAPELAVVDGQCQLTLTSPQDYAVCWYARTYDVPAGQPLELRMDVISLNGDDVLTGLGVTFGQPTEKPNNNAYVVYYSNRRVALLKDVGLQSLTLFDQGMRQIAEPVTLSLTLTRQGASMGVRVKAVLRDRPGEEAFSRQVLDPSPLSGPVCAVIFNITTIGSSVPRPQVICDNLAISAEAMPERLEATPAAEGKVKLAWCNQGVLLESTSLDGPWQPCPEVFSWKDGAFGLSVPAGEPARFFRVGTGMQVVDRFKTTEPFTPWLVTSPVGDTIHCPRMVVTGGRGRIRGNRATNQDFVLGWDFSFWLHRTALASVDILDWDETMQDAEFGLLLRVRSTQPLWICQTEGLPHDRHAGLLAFRKESSPGESVLSITGPGGEVLERRRIPAVDPARQYRLQFSAVGDRLRLALFDLANLGHPLEICEARDQRVSEGRAALYGTRSANDLYDVTIGEYRLTEVWR